MPQGVFFFKPHSNLIVTVNFNNLDHPAVYLAPTPLIHYFTEYLRILTSWQHINLYFSSKKVHKNTKEVSYESYNKTRFMPGYSTNWLLHVTAITSAWKANVNKQLLMLMTFFDKLLLEHKKLGFLFLDNEGANLMCT